MNRSILFALILTVPSLAAAQSQLFSNARVGVGNLAIAPGRITDLPGSGSIGSTASWKEATGSFSGDDRDGNFQTMDFYGYAESSSAFGQLHTYADGNVSNSFYNEHNPAYYDDNTGNINPNGTPDYLVALAYAGFEDTLQFGGQLLAGYQARYVFHVHGTNSSNLSPNYTSVGTLAVKIASDPYEYKNHFNAGTMNEIWSTSSHSVAGNFAQKVKVDLYSQFTDQTAFYDDGTYVSGTCDFGSTVTLNGVMMLDANGDVVPTSQWTMTSSSGTTYNKLNAVPEPASLAALIIGGAALARRRRR